jgi:tetratricopeptide (TPR) repeat protein
VSRRRFPKRQVGVSALLTLFSLAVAQPALPHHAVFGQATQVAQEDVVVDESPGSLGSYFRIVAQYRSGQFAEAVQALRSWGVRDVDRALRQLKRQGSRLKECGRGSDGLSPATVEGAALLHANAGLQALFDQTLPEYQDQFRRATELFAWFAKLGCKTERVSARDLHLGVASAALALLHADQAYDVAVQGLELSPGDGDLLLVAASAQEALAFGYQQYQQGEPAALALQLAERHLRKAVESHPDLAEARLRLGRVLQLLGRYQEAETLLDGVARSTAPEESRYLALLFLGQIREGTGRLDRAAEIYGRAVELRPTGQAARLALALAIERDQGAQAARGALLPALLTRPANAPTDPWWTYPRGPDRLGPRLFSELRERVRTP